MKKIALLGLLTATAVTVVGCKKQEEPIVVKDYIADLDKKINLSESYLPIKPYIYEVPTVHAYSTPYATDGNYTVNNTDLSKYAYSSDLFENFSFNIGQVQANLNAVTELFTTLKANLGELEIGKEFNQAVSILEQQATLKGSIKQLPDSRRGFVISMNVTKENVNIADIKVMAEKVDGFVNIHLYAVDTMLEVYSELTAN